MLELGGWGVHVGPGASQARHWLENPAAVLDWLDEAAGRLAGPAAHRDVPDHDT